MSREHSLLISPDGRSEDPAALLELPNATDALRGVVMELADCAFPLLVRGDQRRSSAGGSRRFIYAPSKLDPHAAHWMANKFQTAMPGARLGMDHVIGYMRHHLVLLYAGVILFSAAELAVGLMLMAGLYRGPPRSHRWASRCC